jgi:thiol-disulfide isomerase/thioredoxin
MLVLLGTGSHRPLAAANPVAPDFTLPNHTNGAPVRLYDLAGSVILLEFFWTECGHCQAAAPVIKSGIHDYYEQRAGNADGIPVTVLYVSIASSRPAVDAWMQTYGLDFVVDDTPGYATYSSYGGGGVPKFVVINGVTNSTSHRPWEILYNGSGFSETTTVPALRASIDAVRGTLCPEWINLKVFTNTTFKAAFRAQKGRTNVVQATTNWLDWFTVTNITGSNVVRLLDSQMPENPRRFYRVKVK